MASWLRSLWFGPDIAVIPSATGDAALVAAEHHGVFSDQGECIAIPASQHRSRHCLLASTAAVPTAEAITEQFCSPPRPLRRTLRIVVISDTHEFHRRLFLPPGDILIHCGDVLTIDRFNPAVVSKFNLKNFFAWFNSQPFPLRICIAGNHDRQFEILGKEAIRQAAMPSIYLEDELLDIAGLRVFGSPRSTPNSHGSGNQAFQMEERPDELPPVALRLQTTDAGLQLIETPRSSLSNPERLDFFVSHGSVNCRRIRSAVLRLRPALHFCGHVHEMHGVWRSTEETFERLTPSNAASGGVISVNGASTRGKPMRERLEPPIVLDFALSEERRDLCEFFDAQRELLAPSAGRTGDIA
jgi:hypothetical protein